MNPRRFAAIMRAHVKCMNTDRAPDPPKSLAAYLMGGG